MPAEFCYEDYTSPRATDYRFLTKILGSIRTPGEYRISPVDAVTFQKYIDSHPDYKRKLQYSNSTVVAVMAHPPHDAAANFLIQRILHEVNEMCRPNDANAMQRTGLVRLTNGVYKDADQGIYDHESGRKVIYPGLAIETGDSDSQRKSRRDVKLWLENTNLETKMGISIKIAADKINKTITKVVFDFYDFNIDDVSRTNRIGKPRLLATVDFSGYNGTDETAPPVTFVDIPSYCVFSKGTYPQNFPAHPQPPPMIPLLDSTAARPLSVGDLLMLNNHISIVNDQRKPIRVDLRFVVDRLLEVDWNV